MNDENEFIPEDDDEALDSYGDLEELFEYALGKI